MSRLSVPLTAPAGQRSHSTPPRRKCPLAIQASPNSRFPVLSALRPFLSGRLQSRKGATGTLFWAPQAFRLADPCSVDEAQRVLEEIA